MVSSPFQPTNSLNPVFVATAAHAHTHTHLTLATSSSGHREASEARPALGGEGATTNSRRVDAALISPICWAKEAQGAPKTRRYGETRMPGKLAVAFLC